MHINEVSSFLVLLSICTLDGRLYLTKTKDDNKSLFKQTWSRQIKDLDYNGDSYVSHASDWYQSYYTSDYSELYGSGTKTTLLPTPAPAQQKLRRHHRLEIKP